MGNAAGLKACRCSRTPSASLAIELLAGAQAVEFLAPLEPGRGVAARARRSCGRSRARARARTARCRPTSSASPARSATARSLAAVEAEVAESCRDERRLAATPMPEAPVPRHARSSTRCSRVVIVVIAC